MINYCSCSLHIFRLILFPFAYNISFSISSPWFIVFGTSFCIHLLAHNASYCFESSSPTKYSPFIPHSVYYEILHNLIMKDHYYLYAFLFSYVYIFVSSVIDHPVYIIVFIYFSFFLIYHSVFTHYTLPFFVFLASLYFLFLPTNCLHLSSNAYSSHPLHSLIFFSLFSFTNKNNFPVTQ